MTPHDNAYKNIFSHPQAVRDLLQGFVEEDWVAMLNFDTLEKVSSSYVSDDLRDREDDILWRIRMNGAEEDDWLYVYLLLEFQSSVDTFMAVRILTYIGLLYQDLIKNGQIKLQTKLPPVFPLVLYNGVRAWNAERDLEQLIHTVPKSLAAYLPRLRYFLLDEGRIDEQSLYQSDKSDNTAARLIEIERTKDPENLSPALAKLVLALKAPHNAQLRRAFIVWLNRVVLKRFELFDQLPELHDLPEVQEVIEEHIETWKNNLVQQGVLQGELKGELKGKLEGELKGQAQALLRLLAHRFGPVPVGVKAQISAASLAQIESWFDTSLDAPSLDAVFAQH